ncbi:MAG: redoxin domain-containing protein [Nitrospirae bacterium]|nr:redoxin domain-containing protein [Nitrospirota bacterium]
MRHILPSILFLFLTFSVREAVCLETAPQIGKLAPEFSLNDLSGNKVNLSDYKGKVILINFWATFCVPCKAEMPSLNNLFLAFKNNGLIVLAISTDDSEKPVQSFIKEKAIAFPVLMDKDQEVYFDLYGVLGLPTSFLIDRDGIIREKIRGERVWDAPDMKEKISMWLSKTDSVKSSMKQRVDP